MSYGYVDADGGFTVEIWFRRTANPSDWAPLIYQSTQSSGQIQGGGLGAAGRQFWVGLNSSGAFYVNFYTETGTSIFSWTDASPTGYGSDSQWHHLAVRLGTDKRTVTTFLDGQVYNTGTASVVWDVTSGVMTVAGEAAQHRGWTGLLWDARVDYFAAYNRALTDNRIQIHYTAGNGGTVYYGDGESTRISRLLDWSDVPRQSRSLDDSVTTLQGIEVANANALEKLHDSVNAAFGLVFADGQTRIVYLNRRHGYNRFNAATLGESLNSAPTIDFKFSSDYTWIYNDVRGSRPFGERVRLQDALSRAKFGRRVKSFEVPLTSSTELRNAVSWFLGRYSVARPRISAVKFSAVGSDLIEFVTTGGVQVNDVITITDLDAGNAPAKTMMFTVEGLRLDADFTDKNWSMTFSLSPYELNKVFQIGVSALGDGSYVAY